MIRRARSETATGIDRALGGFMHEAAFDRVAELCDKWHPGVTERH